MEPAFWPPAFRPPVTLKLFLLFGEPYDQAILIAQFGADTIEHFFGFLGRRFIIIGSNHHGGCNQPVLGVIDVETIFVHSCRSFTAK